MAIDFGHVNDQQVQFFPISYSRTGNISLCSTFELDSLTYGGAFIVETDPTQTYVSALTYYSNRIFYATSFTTTDGIWEVSQANSGLVAGQKFEVCVTYAGTGTPIFYVNGVSKPVTTGQAPSGTMINFESGGVVVGGKSFLSADMASFDGRIIRDLIHNRILTATEIKDMYDGRGKAIPRNGLVFCPMMYGARGLQAFDGATLTGDNKIIDPCSGAVGTPVGSPVGLGETYLSLK